MNQTTYLLRQAWASLKGQPLFIGAIVSTMGLTLGALLAVLTLGYLLLIAPLSYPQQQTLYSVENRLIDETGKVDGQAFTYPNLMHLYTKQQVFSEAALSYYDADVLLNNPSRPTMSLAYITPEWLNILSAKMVMGRPFSDTEAVNSYHPVAILSYQTWKNDFALAADILSKKVQFGEVSYRIVGVLSESFIEPELLDIGMQSQVFLPWDYNSVSLRDRQSWGNDDGALKFLGKLTAPKNVPQIEQSLTTLVNDNWQQQVAEQGFFKGWGIGVKVASLESVILGNSQNTVYLLIAGVVGLVLLACTNIANLFMSRTAKQQQKLAILAALGASQRQLFKTLLAEAFILMSLSGGLALYVANLAFALMRQYLDVYLPRVSELSLQLGTVATALVFVMGLALLFAYLSSAMINYQKLSQTIQTSGKGVGVQVAKNTRQMLIFCQIAIATVIVFINMLLFKDALAVIQQPLGFATDDTSIMVITTPKVSDSERETLKADLSELQSKLLALSSIAAVSQSMAPMSFKTLALSRENQQFRYSLKAKDIDHRYFQLIQQPLLQGQYFSDADIKDRNKVMIVNDVFAQQLAANGEVLGMRFDNGFTIVGVVNGIRVPGDKTITPRFYYPASQSRNMFILKTYPGQHLARQDIVNALAEVSGELNLFSFTTVNQRKQQALFSQYTTAITSGVLATLTILLAGVGLYGILSYATQVRRFEIGTRLALGAKRKHIVGMVMRDNAKVVLLAICSSTLALLAIYLGFSSSIAPTLSTLHIILFLATLGLISGLSYIACYWPLRKYINQPVVHSLRGSD